MSEAGPAWIVLARDLSDTVRASGQPRVSVTLILDADTGLIRGVSVDATIRRACSAAARTALTVPAGPLPPLPPVAVIYDEAHADQILPALADALPDPQAPALFPGPIPAEAEDCFDSLVGHLAGRSQPADLPGPEDWARLYASAATYCRSAPWQLWADADHLPLTVDLDGESTRYDVIVYGGQGIQRGLAALPVAQAPVPPANRLSGGANRYGGQGRSLGSGSRSRELGTGYGTAPRQVPLPAGTPVLWLDPTGEVPRQHLAKARRYGWPDDADLAPSVALVSAQGLGDLDRTAARHLALALTAVAAHQGPRRSDTTTGTVAFADGLLGRYTINDPPPTDAAPPQAAPAPVTASATSATSATPATSAASAASATPATSAASATSATPPSAGAPAALGPLRTARLRVTMREVTPPVVRVVDVPAAANLPELHDLLQVAIGWTNSHLHEFVTEDGCRYGRPDLDFGYEVQDETTAALRDLPDRFTYRYDFGDCWEHDVEVVGRGGPQPGCVVGEGACPPEDCGGPHRYTELLEVLADPTHPDHEHLRGWASGRSTAWSEATRQDVDALVRATVGQVPASVRLVLDLIGDKIRLTPGGRLPRALVRAVQEQRPGWALWGKPAALEEDLPPLADLHDLLRRVGLLRLARGVLTPTKAAGDDLQIIRRLRRVFEPDDFDDILAGVAVAHLADRGPLSRQEVAALAHPWLERWSVEGRPVTADDVDASLTSVRDVLEALDLIRVEDRIWHPGPSAETLLPRATSLAHLLRRQGRAT
jgi:hypothetical protein